MFIATNQIKFKLLAVVVVIALVMPIVMVPAGAAQAVKTNVATSDGNEFDLRKDVDLRDIEVLFKQHVTLKELERFIELHEIVPTEVLYESENGNWCGGFSIVNNGIYSSVDKVVRSLQENIELIEKELKQEELKQEEKEGLENLLKVLKEDLFSFKNGTIKVKGFIATINGNKLAVLQQSNQIEVKLIVDENKISHQDDPDQHWGSQTWYAPDRGEYWIDKGYVYSYFYWEGDLHFCREKYNAYEHEFRIANQGFAGYNGYWNSNLPAAKVDIEDNRWLTDYDEFCVRSEDDWAGESFEDIKTGQQYWVFIDLHCDGDYSDVKYQVEGELEITLTRLWVDKLAWGTLTRSVPRDQGRW